MFTKTLENLRRGLSPTAKFMHRTPLAKTLRDLYLTNFTHMNASHIIVLILTSVVTYTEAFQGKQRL
jgi:hypothetical protein